MNTETVYILDDDPDQGELIALTLNGHGLPTSIYTRPEHFLSEISPDFVGCLLLDLRMPLLSGLEVQQTLIDRQIPLPVIFLTSFGDLDAAVTSLKKGALDFIQKPVAPQHLVESVKRAILVSKETARLQTQQKDLVSLLKKLTPREQEVLHCITKGSSAKEIGRKLGISPRTAEIHRSRIMKKLCVHSLTELIEIPDIQS